MCAPQDAEDLSVMSKFERHRRPSGKRRPPSARLPAQYKMDRAGWRNGLNRYEASAAKPLIDLACRPAMAARADRVEFAEGVRQGRRPGRVEANDEPAARREHFRDAGEHILRRRDGEERHRQPGERVRIIVSQILHPLGAELYSAGEPAFGDVLMGDGQRRPPRIDADDPQRGPAARNLDRQPRDARADVEERSWTFQYRRQRRPLFSNRGDGTDIEARCQSLRFENQGSS